ncbi:hypothetical protein PVK06_009581 [Gossypium arboreum]|uniref:Uncharacterized protein n=1 Tax=Gossypium arboreum TaxID=29729 RepID=A0ABR0QNZ2_GOSAR|nr:hypothetical protein PVK06_009581 [Gossypium arboreum]
MREQREESRDEMTLMIQMKRNLINGKGLAENPKNPNTRGYQHYTNGIEDPIYPPGFTPPHVPLGGIVPSNTIVSDLNDPKKLEKLKIGAPIQPEFIDAQDRCNTPHPT